MNIKKRFNKKYLSEEMIAYKKLRIGKTSIIISLVLFISFFFFINNKKMSKEFATVNVWIKDATEYGEPFDDKSIKIEGDFWLDFFTLNGQFIHYFNKDGNSISYKTLGKDEFASMNKNNYIVYKRFGLDILAFDKFGRSLWATNSSVYPEAAPYANIISLHSSENSSFTLIDWNNAMLTDGSKRYGEYITDTAFAKETGDYVVGYINGNIIMYYRTGKLGFQMIPIISKINVAKAVAITERGSFIASVTGIDDEYISMYNSTGNLLWHANTYGDARKNVYMGISEYAMLASMLNENSINIYSLMTGDIKNSVLLQKYNIGEIKYMKFDYSESEALFAVSSDNKSVVIVYDIKTNKIIWEKIFDEQIYNISIAKEYNQYLIITKNYIYAFKRIQI